MAFALTKLPFVCHFILLRITYLIFKQPLFSSKKFFATLSLYTQSAKWVWDCECFFLVELMSFFSTLQYFCLSFVLFYEVIIKIIIDASINGGLYYFRKAPNRIGCQLINLSIDEKCRWRFLALLTNTQRYSFIRYSFKF